MAAEILEIKRLLTNLEQSARAVDATLAGRARGLTYIAFTLVRAIEEEIPGFTKTLLAHLDTLLVDLPTLAGDSAELHLELRRCLLETPGLRG